MKTRIKPERLLEIVDGFSTKSVLVAGDVMLDWTIAGIANGLSPEAVAIKVLARSRDFSFRPGGAANIVANFRDLNAERVALWGVIDSDSHQDSDGWFSFGFVLKSILEQQGVEWIGETDPGRETTVKLRIEASHAHTSSQQLARIDVETHEPYRPKNLNRLKDGWDVLNVGDYNKGSVSPELMDSLRAEASKHHQPLVVDPKMGKGRDYWQLYHNVVLKPNDMELAELTGETFDLDDDQSMAAVALRFAEKLESDLVVTRGRFGCLVCQVDGQVFPIKTLPVDLPDVAGAGDTFGASLAISLASGASLEEAAHLAILTSFLVVHKKGTATVSQAELIAEIKRRKKEKLYPFA